MKPTRPSERPGLRLSLILYPFVTAAVAINLFMLGLAGAYLDLPSISPVAALCIAVPLGLPATWFAARWLRGLVATAEGGPR